MLAVRERVPGSPDRPRRGAAPLLLVLALCAVAPLHFFETFPNGWDQTEYAWCIKAGFLPHSPYVLFVFLGRGLAWVFPPAVALSLLSFASSIGALVFLYLAVLHLTVTHPSGDRPAGGPATVAHVTDWAEAGGARAAALVAVLLLGTSTVFVRHAGTQEVYAFQLCLVLACAAVLTSASPWRHALGGLIYGGALAAHNASWFVLPALLVLVVARPGGGGRARAVAVWLGAAGATLAVAYGITGLLLPVEPGGRLRELLVYLRGMPPGLAPGTVLAPGFLAESAAGIGRRLVDGGIELTRGPLATGPVGLSVLHFAVAALGLARLVARGRALAGALFLASWALPFLVYEWMLGWNLDYGTYLVFVLPPVCAACGCAVGWLGGLGRVPRLAVGAGVVLALVAPSGLQLRRHWDDTARDRRRHDSATTLAAVFAARALPEDAVVVQPRSEWNANLLPFHAERRHIARIGTQLKLFRSPARWTPMKPDAYTPLTTEALEQLLRAGIPVIAFEQEPLRGANPGVLDPSRFVWRPAGAADLAAGAAALGLPAAPLERFPQPFLEMYRAALAAPNRER